MRKRDKKIRAKKMHKKQKATVTIRNHKDTIFRMIFKSKRELLILYNAVNGTHYTNPNDLQITTFENAIYMNRTKVCFVHFQVFVFYIAQLLFCARSCASIARSAFSIA